MILVDTSAWIEYLRATGSAAAIEVRRLLSDEANQVAMCEPIAMEILAGAIDDGRHAKLEQLVNGLPSLTVDGAVDFRVAAGIYRAARRAGQTIRSLNDCLIAAIAIRHGACMVHRDADFDVIAGITDLVARRP
ncbi:ribonuclease [Mycobacterium kyorinense]|uniref:Ribonuclease VapC n=1 Tax=Mycobacterium kyorinense TaxID=487514 RepID=A0A1A2Z805_9MYCO|nr:PIN domain nuclease [Mycobacterium kyorinense]OBI45637.1 ribonuclease [Mycobacterium kyorinense]